VRRSIADYRFDPADGPGDDVLPAISWAIAISDDYDDGEPRVVLTVEEVGKPGAGLVAHLARHTGTSMFYLDKVGGPAADHVPTRVGGREPLHATALGKATTALVGELGMGGGRFEIALEPIAADAPDAQGAERAEFLVTANAGQPPRPLRKVASGGELSRISLAIEVAALGMDAVQTMVFDEVDSGIGGNVAGIVGRKLRDLGSRRQVLCVTHLPQVAAQGHAHYRVSKAERAGMTQSAVRLLDDGGRQEELARMLGGIEVSSEARAAARRLLSEAEGSPVA